jgi:hypothetical protein
VRTHHRRQRDDLAELTRILASSQYPGLPHHVQARIERALAAEAAGRPLVRSRSAQPARSHRSGDNGTSGRQTARAKARDRLNCTGPGGRG